MKTSALHVKRLAIVSIFSALGVVVAPFSWFAFVGTKAFPGQHMVNALLGVFVGPFWTAVAATIIGIIRNALGIGTPYAFPGGIPGGIVVGVVYWLLKRFKLNEKIRLASALAEPIGTVIIGATLSLCLVAPWMGDEKTLGLLSNEGPLLAYLIFGGVWALSSVPGSILGFFILLILNRVGISREALFGEE